MSTSLSFLKESFDSNKKSILNGRHLIVSGVEVFVDFWPIRNESGYIYALKGLSSYTLPWLSQQLNFTYSFLQTNKSSSVDQVGDKPGILNLIKKGECDIAFSVSITSSRASLVDFSQPYNFIAVSYVIPAAESSVNFLAVLQPFTTWVWVAILMAVLTVIFFLCLFTWFTSPDKATSKDIVQNAQKIILYVFGLLFKQVGYPLRKTLPILVMAGAWGLAAFLMGNYYTSLLISYVAAPNPQPLIRSIFELRNRPDLNVVTNKNTNIDTTISNAEIGFIKYIGDKLRAFPESRCTETKKCVELVKTGNTVYTSGKISFLYKAMEDDFKSTGRCNLELGKDNLMSLLLNLALQKRSHLIPILNQSIMRMREAGLVDFWYKQGLADARNCVRPKKKGIEEEGLSPLTLKGLTGAFIVIILGSVMASLLLLGELLVSATVRSICVSML